MDDSDLALDMALQRLDESSEIEEDSQTGSVYSGDGVSQLEVYTPSNLSSNPNPGCMARRGSYHNSGSEESTSLSSFCTDGEGPARSAVYYRSSNSRRVMPSGRNRRGGVVSDSETSRPRKLDRYRGASLSMNVRVPEEEFYYRIKERLMAVSKDRDAMTMKARDLARQKGQTYDEIMAAEWHELPETRKYLLIRSSDEGSPEEANGTIEELIVDDNDERPSSPRLTISPSELTPRTAVSDIEVSGRMGPSSQLEEGMRSLNVRQTMTGMSRSKRSSHRTSSSMLSGTASDSGVGDTWATSEIPTPSANDQRLEDYIRSQSILTNTLPTRERDAHAAAIALMSNSPHPDNLSPHVQMQVSRTTRQQQQQHYHHHHHHHHPSSRSGGGTRHAHNQQRVGGAGAHHYSSGDDSSSVFTMTSQSSTSDLFIPRKTHQPSMYTDSEEPHSYGGNMRCRRTLTTPKRSNPSKQHSQQHPSPLTEQHRPRSTQPPQHPDVMLPAPQQNQLPLSQGGSGGNSGGGGGSGAATGPVHVIYHLDNIPTPFHAKWTNGVGITLGTFKDQVFARKGEYRFFFESFNPDLDMALLEEFTEDESCLPVIRGKIVGRVERAQ